MSVTEELSPEIIRSIHPVDLAMLLEDLTVAERARTFVLIEPAQAAETAQRMHLVPLVAMIRRIDPSRAAATLAALAPERASRVMERLPEAERRALLELMSPRTAEQFRQYPPNTAGRVMRQDVVRVVESWTFEQARSLFDNQAAPRNAMLVVDAGGRLVGLCTLQDVLTARPGDVVRTAMRPNPESCRPEDDKEKVAQRMVDGQLLAMPVVDADNKIVGVVTLQDALTIVQQAGAEDLHRIAGTDVVDSLHTPTHARFRMRLPWILLTLGGELFIALVISVAFRPTLEKVAILSAFMPAIAAAGGNVGLQSTTIIVRALGTGTIRAGMTMRVLWAELRLGILLGLSCGIVAGIVAFLLQHFSHGAATVMPWKLSAAVFLAMVSATCATSIVGALEPLMLHKMKFDPATACGPFVTMFNDLFGTITYFLIATVMFSDVPVK